MYLPGADGAPRVFHRESPEVKTRAQFAIAIPLAFAAVLATLAGCNQAPASWQNLLAARIHDQYPAFEVVQREDGSLLVRRPNLADVPVDVDAIARFCQRGPKDCNYITEQMLLQLQR